MTEMTFFEQVLTIAICSIATMSTRFLPFLLFKPGKSLPPYIQYLGKALPSAVFALLVVYCVKDVHFTGETYGLPEIIAIAITVGLHLWRRNMMLSMAAGTLIYMVLVQTVF